MLVVVINMRPGYDGRQRAYRSVMRSTLRQVAVAESLYFSEHDVYTTNLDTLARLLPDPDLESEGRMTIEIDCADARGWHATVAHRAITQTCSFGADGPPGSRPEAGDPRQSCSDDGDSEYRTGPEGVAIAPDGSFVYAGDTRSHSVSVIETATHRVVGTVRVGSDPRGVAITPDGAFAYAANWSANTVSVIETATKRVVGKVRVSSDPRGVAVTPDGAFVYVASDSVSVIGTAGNAIVATIRVGSPTEEVAISPDGAFVYVTDFFGSCTPGTWFGRCGVSVIETATNSVIDTIRVGRRPLGVAFTPDGAFAYVANRGSNTVSVISTQSRSVVGRVHVGSYPSGVAVTPDGSHVYVTDQFADSVTVIETATNRVLSTVAVGMSPIDVAITPNGAFAYVANSGSNDLSVIEVATNRVIATVKVGVRPTFSFRSLLPWGEGSR